MTVDTVAWAETRGVLTAAGPDAVTYLQGQCSQDIAGLAVGASAPTFVLEPQGRVVALALATRTAEEQVELDVHPDALEPLLARLTRYRLRTKVELDATVVPVVALRGADVPQPGQGRVRPAWWPGERGWDVLDVADPAAVAPEGAAVLDPQAAEAWRVRSGRPVPADLDERAVPAETGVVDAAASFTKGCYTGQELVARMDSRGATAPRTLRTLGGTLPPPATGAEVLAGGKVVARLTSVVADGQDGWLALALLGRGAGDAPLALADGRPVHARP